MRWNGIRACGLALASVLLSGSGGPLEVLAEEGRIYRWVDEQGQVHFGETPPAHARAETWEADEGRVQAIPETSRVRAQPKVRPPRATTNRPGAASKKTERPLAEEDECGPMAATLREQVQERQREIEALEAAIERTENNPVVSSDTTCFGHPYDRPEGCDTYYDREHELERLGRKLESARAALEHAEDTARRAGVPPGCLRE